MYKIVVLLVLCHQVLSQPVVQDESVRNTRELQECCPCPKARDGDDQVSRSVDLDCPCRSRADDSDGASSLFFPSAILPEGFSRATEPKDDPKNLLEPEVALATSMLDTLREATEEEYRDALARDAARAEKDALSEEARNVVIIVNPDSDDAMLPEATNIQESRWAPMTGDPSNRLRTPFDFLPEPLKISKLKLPVFTHRNSLPDSNVGASNFVGSVIEPSRNQFPFSPQPFFRQGGLSFSNTVLKPVNGIQNIPLSVVERVDESFKTRPALRESTRPLLNLKPLTFKTDLISAPSNTHDVGKDAEDDSNILNHTKGPLNLKNLLKLKDVELIPTTLRTKPSIKPISLFKEQPNILREANKIEENIECNEESKNVIDKSAPKEIATLPSQVLRSSADNLLKEDQSLSPSENKLSVLKVTENVIKDAVLPQDQARNDVDCEITPIKESTVKLREIDDSSDISEILPVTGSSPILLEDSKNEDTIKAESIEEIDDENEETESDIPDINDDSELIIQEDEQFETLPEDEVLFTDIFDNRDSTKDETIKDKVLPKIKSTDQLDRANLLTDNKSTFSEINSGKVSQIGQTNLERTNEKSNDRSLSINDLQKMSDKLLDTDLESKLGNKDRVTSSSHIKDSTNSRKSEAKEQIPSENVQKKEKTVCITDTKPQDTREMETGASDAVINTFPRLFDPLSTKLRLADPIVDPLDLLAKPLENVLPPLNAKLRLNEPLSRDEIGIQNSNPLKLLSRPIEDVLNINKKIPTLDEIKGRISNTPVLNPNLNLPGLDTLKERLSINDVLNTNLPILDGIRDQISSMFNTNDGSGEEESLESFFSNDTPPEAISPAASTNNALIKLPSRTFLEGIANDVIQEAPTALSPLDFISKSAKSSLNSYKAKVPVPDNLDLKPITIRNGKKVLPKISEFSSNSKAKTVFIPKESTFKGIPLHDLPTLDELRNSLQTNTKSLLGTSNPKLSDSNLFKSTVRSSSIDDLTKDFRKNAEKTMKSLQHRMKIPLQTAKMSNVFEDKLSNPHEFIEDVNDKLKAIHYDLNDRLSSFHENIFDQSKIKPLSIINDPPLKLSKTSNRNVMTNFKSKGKPARLLTSESSPHIETIKHKKTERKAEPKADTDDRRISKFKSHGPQGAESSPVIARVSVPNAPKSPISHLHRASPKNVQSLPTFRFSSQPIKPLARQPLMLQPKTANFGNIHRPFSDLRNAKKVKITFGSTTIRPVPVEKNTILHKPPTISTANKSALDKISTSYDQKYRNSDVKTAPSERHSLKISPLNGNSRNSEDKVPLTEFSAKPTLKPSGLKNSIFKSANGGNILKNNLRIPTLFEKADMKEKESNPAKSVTNITDQHAVPKLQKNILPSNSDMSKSASTDVEIRKKHNSPEPMKENVSYKCKMVCTKEKR